MTKKEMQEITKAAKRLLSQELNTIVPGGRGKTRERAYGYKLSKDDAKTLRPFLQASYSVEYRIGEVTLSKEHQLTAAELTLGDDVYIIPMSHPRYFKSEFAGMIEVLLYSGHRIASKHYSQKDSSK